MGHPIGSFEITQPLEEHQRRLAAQRPRWRPPYVPNAVPLVSRVLLAITTMTWTAWALVGLLSGHMFVLLSRRGPVHLSGAAALMFSIAVLVAAAACLLPIIDHYDRRDNEAAYRAVRRRLWWSVAAIVLTSLVVGCVGPDTGRLGLLDAQGMTQLSRSAELVRWLVPHAELFESVALAGFCVVLVLGLAQLVLARGREMPPMAALAVLYLAVAPCLLAFTCMMLLWICNGDAAADALARGNAEARLALAWSALVASSGALLLLVACLPFALWRLVTGQLTRQEGTRRASPARRSPAR